MTNPGILEPGKRVVVICDGRELTGTVGAVTRSDTPLKYAAILAMVFVGMYSADVAWDAAPWSLKQVWFLISAVAWGYLVVLMARASVMVRRDV